MEKAVYDACWMGQPVNGFWQNVDDSPGQKVLQGTKAAPVSHDVVEKGTWDVTGVGTVTKKQADGLSWTVTVA